MLGGAGWRGSSLGGVFDDSTCLRILEFLRLEPSGGRVRQWLVRWIAGIGGRLI